MNISQNAMDIAHKSIIKYAHQLAKTQPSNFKALVEDLVIEGEIGILQAKQYWKPKGGSSFSTFAVIIASRRMYEYFKQQVHWSRFVILETEFNEGYDLSQDCVMDEQIDRAVDEEDQLSDSDVEAIARDVQGGENNDSPDGAD